jgi:transposase
MDQVRSKQTLIDKLTHEMATLKRLKFAATSEAYTGERQQLLFETIDTDLAALSAEIGKLHRLRRPGQTNSNPNVHHYPPICHGAR